MFYYYFVKYLNYFFDESKQNKIIFKKKKIIPLSTEIDINNMHKNHSMIVFYDVYFDYNYVASRTNQDRAIFDINCYLSIKFIILFILFLIHMIKEKTTFVVNIYKWRPQMDSNH